MKAATINEHGGVEVIRVQDIPEPEPRHGEVILSVHAAALNRLDIWVRRGGRFNPPKPHVMGSDAAGVVAELGGGVAGLKAGDEVVLNPALSCGRCEYCLRGEQNTCPSFGIIGASRSGVFAQRVAVPAASLLPKPAHLTFEQAAALPVAYVTAWRMLMTRAGLKPGQSVLIHGIGGGVALAGLQIAKLAGATVVATSSSDEKLAAAAKLGADVTLNYRRRDDLAAAILQATGGRCVDVAFETVGSATWAIDFEVVRRGGTIVICGVTSGPKAETDLQALYWNQLTILGSTSGSAEDFRQLLVAVSAQRLEPVIDSIYPLENVREATARMEAGLQFGKIILTMPA